MHCAFPPPAPAQPPGCHLEPSFLGSPRFPAREAFPVLVDMTSLTARLFLCDTSHDQKNKALFHGKQGGHLDPCIGTLLVSRCSQVYQLAFGPKNSSVNVKNNLNENEGIHVAPPAVGGVLGTAPRAWKRHQASLSDLPRARHKRAGQASLL